MPSLEQERPEVQYLTASLIGLAFLLVAKPAIVAAIVAPLLRSSRRNFLVAHFPSLCDFSHKSRGAY